MFHVYRLQYVLRIWDYSTFYVYDSNSYHYSTSCPSWSWMTTRYIFISSDASTTLSATHSPLTFLTSSHPASRSDRLIRPSSDIEMWHKSKKSFWSFSRDSLYGDFVDFVVVLVIPSLRRYKTKDDERDYGRETSRSFWDRLSFSSWTLYESWTWSLIMRICHRIKKSRLRYEYSRTI